MPLDKVYVPLQVGTELNGKIKGYTYDNKADNISDKNPYFVS